MLWWPRHTPKIGNWPMKWRMAETEIPASLGEHGPGETTSLSGARLHALQQIFHGETLLVEGRIEACLVTLTGKPRRLPENVRVLLTPLLYEPPLPMDKP